MHRRRKVKKNKGAERRGVVGASSAALQEAQDIFGGVDELLQQYMNRERAGDDEDQEVRNRCPGGQVRFLQCRKRWKLRPFFNERRAWTIFSFPSGQISVC
jgi:hypothetical protein